MSNQYPTFRPSESQQRFIEAFVQLLLPWGMPIAAARLYVYLLIAGVPVSLDEFAEGLGISKSVASTAARFLQSGGVARRLTERGSKRIRYVVNKNPGAALRRHVELLGEMADLIDANKDKVTSGDAREELNALASFHRQLQAAMGAVIS